MRSELQGHDTTDHVKSSFGGTIAKMISERSLGGLETS